MTENDLSKRVDASPTKEFFISMLVKDIGLIRAILDLVDNCVDGARRLASNGDYREFHIQLVVDKELFEITDNCGGIPLDIARDYAFRFGRPAQMVPTKHSVGQFGVGMKRSLFKLGTKFRVESKTDSTHFVIAENVEEWKLKPEWSFEFNQAEQGLVIPREDRGTSISVTALHESVAEEFATESFHTRLKAELESAHQDIVERGMSISLNKFPVTLQLAELLQSNDLKPAYKELSFGDPPNSMAVKLYAGIAESDPSSAGWYIYCNGRMVLDANQSLTTGWGENSGRTIPKYHNQYARFRGYAFLDSDETGLLPWNTTKTGVDEDSKIYRAIRLEIIKLMRPVIDFLNKLDAEKEKEQTDLKPLGQALAQASAVRTKVITQQTSFVAPKVDAAPPTPANSRISYVRKVEDVEKAKSILRVSSNREVGEKTFDYFMKREAD